MHEAELVRQVGACRDLFKGAEPDFAAVDRWNPVLNRGDLFRYDLEMFKKVLPERHRDRNVTGVATPTDQDPSDPACVMPSVEGVPVRAKINLDPGAEIHWFDVRRNANVAEIPGRVTRRNIHAPAQSHREMSKVAADTDFFAERFQGRTIGARLQVIETEMTVDEVTNRLHTLPSKGRLTKGLPSEIQQFTVDFTVAAWQ
jgi:hypothetical protein